MNLWNGPLGRTFGAIHFLQAQRALTYRLVPLCVVHVGIMTSRLPRPIGFHRRIGCRWDLSASVKKFFIGDESKWLDVTMTIEFKRNVSSRLQIDHSMHFTSFLLTLALLTCMTNATAEDRLSPNVESYVKKRLVEGAEIPEDRQKELLKISRYVAECQAQGKPAKLLFVCTHNSRRSHLAQLWAKIGATHFGLVGIETFSGGTETTAMNRRTVAALQRAGLEITAAEDDVTNPKYSVVFGKVASPHICFSKTLTEPPNPTEKFAAIMTCSSADASCPTVTGCELRLSLPYEDPKVADNTPREATAYDDKCKEIAREMLFVMSRVVER